MMGRWCEISMSPLNKPPNKIKPLFSNFLHFSWVLAEAWYLVQSFLLWTFADSQSFYCVSWSSEGAKTRYGSGFLRTGLGNTGLVFPRKLQNLVCPCLPPIYRLQISGLLGSSFITEMWVQMLAGTSQCCVSKLAVWHSWYSKTTALQTRHPCVSTPELTAVADLVRCKVPHELLVVPNFLAVGSRWP